MSPDPKDIPPFPRERDYDNTPQGAIDYARDIGEWARSYTDATDHHRKAGVEMWSREFGEMVKQHDEDLRTLTSMRPGWVAVAIRDIHTQIERFIDQVAKDNVALLEDNENIRQEIKWFKRIALTTLISFAAYVTQQLVTRGSLK